MQFSAFGEKFTQHSGILQLMDDLGDALKSDKPVNMLGGGNPARIPEIDRAFADIFSKLAAEHAVENIGNYSNPQGDAALIDALTAFLNREYGWNLTADNIALTNGSQNAFFYLFNLFGGKFNLSDGTSAEKAILLPLAPEVVKAVSSLNAIVNLAPTRFGAAIATPLLESGEMKRLADQVIRPFYRNQAQTAVSLLKHELGAYPMKIHKPEGAIFLWLWFENLPVSSQTLYEMLKAEGTLIIPGEHFFVGIDTQDYPHAGECIRMSIAQDAHTLEKGIAAIGKTVRKLYDNV